MVSRFDYYRPRFHPGQVFAYRSQKRIVVLCCGTGGGKSLIGSYRTLREAQRWGGERVNLVACAPTFPIMWQSTYFAMDNLFPLMGWEFRGGQDKKYWEHSKFGAKIWIRTGTNPDAIEGIPKVKFIWADEAGKLSRGFWVNLQTRTGFEQATVFMTTTPYPPVWLLNDIIRPTEKLGTTERKVIKVRGVDVEFQFSSTPEIDFVNFPSIANPTYPVEEFERQRRMLDPLIFARRFEGKYTRLLGLVYGSYGTHLIVDPSELPVGVRYYGGVDWGYSNDPFAVSIRAVTLEGEHYCVKVYKGYYKTISDKIQILRGLRSLYPVHTWICDKSEPADIAELNKAKLTAVASSNPTGKYSIETGIEKHNELMRSGKYKIFADCGSDLQDEYESYIRDEESGKPVDENNHLMDCERMLSEYLHDYAPVKHKVSVNILNNEKKISAWD